MSIMQQLAHKLASENGLHERQNISKQWKQQKIAYKHGNYKWAGKAICC